MPRLVLLLLSAVRPSRRGVIADADFLHVTGCGADVSVPQLLSRRKQQTPDTSGHEKTGFFLFGRV